MVDGKYNSYDRVKRVFDIVGSALALIAASPLFLVSAALIKLDGGPVFFTQDRIGKDGRTFKMLKLRTMIPDASRMETHLRKKHAASGGYGVASKYTDPRITRIGAILRLLNLDELPQLVNILKGDMSLVGPRPVPYEESLFYADHRDEVFSIRPGLTGYWQIKRRMSTDYDERVSLDSHYVRNRSLFLDAYIFLVTPIAMLTSDYNSVTKPLPPPSDGILISKKAALRVASGVQREEHIAESGLKL